MSKVRYAKQSYSDVWVTYPDDIFKVYDDGRYQRWERSHHKWGEMFGYEKFNWELHLTEKNIKNIIELTEKEVFMELL